MIGWLQSKRIQETTKTKLLYTIRNYTDSVGFINFCLSYNRLTSHSEIVTLLVRIYAAFVPFQQQVMPRFGRLRNNKSQIKQALKYDKIHIKYT